MHVCMVQFEINLSIYVVCIVGYSYTSFMYCRVYSYTCSTIVGDTVIHVVCIVGYSYTCSMYCRGYSYTCCMHYGGYSYTCSIYCGIQLYM